MTKVTFFLFGLCLLGMQFISCKSVNYLTNVEANRINVSSKNKLTPDPAITELIAPYKIELDKVMNQVIGETAIDLKKERPESTLGNWMADAIHRKAEEKLGTPIDFALQNYGGIRIPEIKKGAITRGKIYELMPFDNKILVLFLNKSEVEELVQHIVEARGWPVSYGIKINKLTEEDITVLINDKPLAEGKIYKVALPDYIANGGSRSYFLKDKKREDLQYFIRDALIKDVEDYTARKEAINSPKEGRFILQNRE